MKKFQLDASLKFGGEKQIRFHDLLFIGIILIEVIQGFL